MQLPKIGLDIDGVKLDIITPLLKFYNRLNGTGYTVNDINDYALTGLFGNDFEARKRFVFDLYRTPEFRDIKPVPGAQQGVAALSKKASLVSLTSRPVAEVGNETRAQIRRYFPKAFPEIHFTRDFASNSKGDGKAEVCKTLGIDIMVDDSFEYAVTCAGQGIETILLDCVWNRERRYGPLPQNAYRARGWPQIVRKVDELLEA